MTQFSNATFSVGGRHCDGCSQRDVWLDLKDGEIVELKARINNLENQLAFNKFPSESMRGL